MSSQIFNTQDEPTSEVTQISRKASEDSAGNRTSVGNCEFVGPFNNDNYHHDDTKSPECQEEIIRQVSGLDEQPIEECEANESCEVDDTSDQTDRNPESGAQVSEPDIDRNANPVSSEDHNHNNIQPSFELSEKEFVEINDAFDVNCSQDGRENLNSDGLRTAIRSLGFEPRINEIQRLLEEFSTDGLIDRQNFLKIMLNKMGNSSGNKDNSLNEEISKVFDLLDLDKKGMITVDNLRAISKELNEEINDIELHEMIIEADLDGDSKINKKEFFNIMKKTSLY